MLQQIFTGQDSDATSVVVDHSGGLVEVIVAGDFGSGTATLEAYYADVGEWVPVSGGTWTASMVRILQTVRKCQLRLSLADSTSPDLNAWI